MPRRVFITVAEASADQHAGHLVRQLKAIDPDLIVEGHGGPAMRAAGVVIHHETVRRAAMGLRAIGRAFEVRRLLKWTDAYFSRNPPDLQICCDSWAMNVHFARLAKRHGAKVLYYIAPQVWASRKGRIRKLRVVVDKLACILPFEEEYFRRHDVNATYVGHPLFDELPSDRATIDRPALQDRPPVIGLLPGSRKYIAAANFPHQLNVMHLIHDAFPGARFLVPTTPATQPAVDAALNRLVESSGGRLTRAGSDAGEVRGDNGLVLQYAPRAFDQFVPRCDLCVTVSGTATLHVAGYGVPMIVVYRGNPILWHLLGRWIIKTRTYSLVNLLADSHAHIVPEFIPWYGSDEPVAQKALEFLRNPALLSQQSEKLRQLVRAIDQPGASQNTARLAMELLSARARDVSAISR